MEGWRVSGVEGPNGSGRDETEKKTRAPVKKTTRSGEQRDDGNKPTSCLLSSSRPRRRNEGRLIQRRAVVKALN